MVRFHSYVAVDQQILEGLQWISRLDKVIGDDIAGQHILGVRKVSSSNVASQARVERSTTHRAGGTGPAQHTQHCVRLLHRWVAQTRAPFLRYKMALGRQCLLAYSSARRVRAAATQPRNKSQSTPRTGRAPHSGWSFDRLHKRISVVTTRDLKVVTTENRLSSRSKLQ
eukprot:COSAG01_NODE_27707_length_679_cov_0.737931_1_plen_168_part_01